MCFPFLATNVSPHSIMLLRANTSLFKLPFENQLSKRLGQSILLWLSLGFHHLCLISWESINFLRWCTLWTIILFIPKQRFLACKLFRSPNDTTIASTTLRITYLSFLIAYFRPVQALYMLSPTVAHCCNCFWFWKNPSKWGCRHGRHNNFSITIFWNSIVFGFNISKTMETISFAKMCGTLLEPVFGALHSRMGMQAFVDAQNLGRGAMMSRFSMPSLFAFA